MQAPGSKPVNVWRRSAKDHRAGTAGKCALCQRSYPCPTVRRQVIHVVAAVTFTKGVPDDDSPVTCTCGEIVKVADFPAHRKGAIVPLTAA
jgi:hypothetical protein